MRHILTSLIEHGLSADKIIVIPVPPSEGHKWKAFVENRDGTKMERPAKTNEINKR